MRRSYTEESDTEESSEDWVDRDLKGSSAEDAENFFRRKALPYWSIIFYNFDSISIANETMRLFDDNKQKELYGLTTKQNVLFINESTGERFNSYISKDQTYFIEHLLPVLALRENNPLILRAIMMHTDCNPNIKKLLLQNPNMPTEFSRTIITKMDAITLKNLFEDPKYKGVSTLIRNQLSLLEFQNAVICCIEECSKGLHFLGYSMFGKRIMPAQFSKLKTAVNACRTVDEIQNKITAFLQSDTQKKVVVIEEMTARLRVELGILIRESRWSAASPNSTYIEAFAASPSTPQQKPVF